MEPYFKLDNVALYLGDCREVMSKFPNNCIDSIVTDPPYELGFMGKSWDAKGIAYNVEMWQQALRVLKPGGYLLAFGAPRTYHRLACAIEDAGFEIRDTLMWMFGSGFPKSLDVSKAIDKTAGAERKIVGKRIDGRYAYEFKGTANRPTGAPAGSEEANRIGGFVSDKSLVTAPATELAQQYDGWGTALKPAYEPVVMARKPLVSTVAANVAAWGTGGLNIDGCRIEGVPPSVPQPIFNSPTGHTYGFKAGEGRNGELSHAVGRWPANVLLDEEAAALLDSMSGELTSGKSEGFKGDFKAEIYGKYAQNLINPDTVHGDSGGASRFFYTSKTSRAEREYALGDLVTVRRSDGRETEHHVTNLRTTARRNDHPTVKPIDLMRWLCRLVTPPNGVILDPFVGSGSTGFAAFNEGFKFIGIDLAEHYLEIAKERIPHKQVTNSEMTKSIKVQGKQRDMAKRGYKSLLDMGHQE